MQVSPDKDMRAARLCELETMRVAAETEILEQRSACQDGDPDVVSLRGRKVELRQAELDAIEAEIAAIGAHGKVVAEASPPPPPPPSPAKRRRKGK